MTAFVALVLDVTHQEGEDNLLYASKTNETNASLHHLRGMLAAAAGACRTVFLDCISSASLHPDVQAAYVDQGDLLFVLLHAPSSQLISIPTREYLEQCAQRSFGLLLSACGPPGPKLVHWKSDDLDLLCKPLFRLFDHELSEGVMSALFPRAIPALRLSLSSLFAFHGYLSEPLPNSCCGRAFFHDGQLVHSELDSNQTYILFQWRAFFGSPDSPEASLASRAIFVDRQPFELLFLRHDRWSLCALYTREASVDVASAQDLLVAIHRHVTVDKASSWTTGAADACHVVGFDLVDHSVLEHTAPSMADAANRRAFAQHVQGMRRRFLHAQDLYDRVHATVIEQPMRPLADENDDSLAAPDMGVLPSRLSIFRPDPVVANAISHQVMRVRMDKAVRWVVGARYAAWELYAWLDPARTTMEAVEALFDELVAFGSLTHNDTCDEAAPKAE
ncbi:Aste57867_18407 [Aphanomyces stellatus]|uniref:Aste57867_18407 protein n=1 Tax=Aphanomyces stellatus TaxID=120398 RepID=A0A485LDR3_9STRA|nr:hypothetical protein As57867_018345 [Aphanomyces stellatus]VFT95143.1 Aste57867_18407 [Aphanomyces stellatus]